MSVLRINKRTKNFLILDKTCLNQADLSWGAKGLHAYLMSLPEDWQVKVSDLKNRSTNGRDSVRGLLNELEKAGYISKEWIRNELKGTFTGIEYIVYETPQNKISDPPSPKNPSTENQFLEKPDTAKATLININNNKYTDNKKITAAKNWDHKQNLKSEKLEKAAAAISNKNLFPQKYASSTKHIDFLTPEDSIIGKELTNYQLSRIENLVRSLNLEDKEKISKEIQHCLLNQKYFTGCGKDFSRKLNAIKLVISRGEWQTPSDMVLETKQKNTQVSNNLQQELREAYSEFNHFKKLLGAAKDHAKDCFQNIVKNAQIKIKQLEEKIQQASGFSEVSVH